MEAIFLSRMERSAIEGSPFSLGKDPVDDLVS